ncbi:MAG: helix-turn-helix domain-containing protein [Candidatus Omnitrophica bacterium]|nr:helix-turn-helix domain-containing protein [Candidatus Omnitrophota bacterium]
MRKKRKDRVPEQREEKILDVHAGMQGTLRFDDPVNLRINGKFEGTLDTKGKLMVGDKAKIQANITGESVSIAGEVFGNIKASSLLVLQSTAQLNGDVQTPRLSIDEGAVLNGRIEMTGNTSGPENIRMTTSQLAGYLEVDLEKISEWADSGKLPASKESGEWMFDRNKVDQWIAQGKVKA